ncbi:hypothetical protein CQW23_17615 [Capsicum baccatum]|uniref:Cytochrome n=1 Tax=Capsicum baccatum TaxID=33114 RepID=A0A2G2WEP6_CAPBA|nr:hypothetical protein CQW23_17615 [Capsicum baccatum]
MEILSNIAILCVAFLLVYTRKILNWAWFRPKKLEKYLIENGLTGNPYKLLYGDLKELKKSVIEAQSKPINFSDDIAQKLIPFFLNAINKNGGIPYKYPIPRPIWNPTLTRWGSLQPEYATRVGVSESDMPHGT